MRNASSLIRSFGASQWRRRLGRQTLRWSSSTSNWSTPLAKTIANAIDATGPLSIAAYMRQCLTSAEGGYYTTTRERGDPFGRGGDFVTSPEISSVFGELVGLWILTEWLQQGASKTGVQLIELGPGRGTLMDDVLRTLRRFPSFTSALEQVTLVEASPSLREAQHRLICGQNALRELSTGHESINKHTPLPVKWVEDFHFLEQPGTERATPFFIAHEFFDSLPIHAFQSISQANPPSQSLPESTSLGITPIRPEWRELVVALNSGTAQTKGVHQDPEFQLSIAKAPNPSSMIIPESSPRYKRLKSVPDACIEVCPEGQKYVQDIARLIGHSSKNGGRGAALIIDYGTTSTVPINSLRGIQHHKTVSPFVSPGQVDISADVDFSGLAEAALQASENVEVYGPVEQGHFLHALGIEERVKHLMKKAADDPSKRDDIEKSYKRLVERSGGAMGKIYKAMAIVPESNGKRRPVGFGGDIKDCIS